jgi:hypothetical protein
LAADEAEDDQGGTEDPGRAQDSFVARRRPDPAKPPERTLELVGFLGDSDREGFRRLYFTRELDYFAEFRLEDVADLQDIPAEQHPFMGEQATRVSLRRDAVVDYTRTRTARPVDEFDLDVRLGRDHGPRAANAYWPQTDYAVTGDCYTCATQCDTACPDACVTRIGVSCAFACLPYTVEDPTCARTCMGASCDTGCCRIQEPHPSQIQTACLPACPDPR